MTSFIVLSLLACDRVCERPLDAYCEDCATLDEEIAAAGAGRIEPVGADVWLGRCDHRYSHLLIEYPFAIYGRRQYYLGQELVGVVEWGDQGAWCGLESVRAFEYGEVPACTEYCTVDRWCAAEDCEVRPIQDPCLE